MVTIYIWKPTTVETIVEQGLIPDVGHAAMGVWAENGEARAYVSFWPEIESVIGVVSQLWKPRPTRHPASYTLESDPDGPFMQRPADYEVSLEGLNEEAIVRLWKELAESEYDFLKWNCSNVCKFLMVTGVPVPYRAMIQEAMAVCPDDFNCIDSEDSTLEKLRFLSTSPFIDCRPEDLKRAADAYLAVASAPAAVG